MALDPWHIRLSHHTLDRYMQRRKWSNTDALAVRQDAERAIRNMLARVAHKNPPLRLRDGKASRLYGVGQFAFVVSADGGTVITCYSTAVTAGGQARKRAHKAVRRAREEALT